MPLRSRIYDTFFVLRFHPHLPLLILFSVLLRFERRMCATVGSQPPYPHSVAGAKISPWILLEARCENIVPVLSLVCWHLAVDMGGST
jgi:hypothetical protein